MNVLLIGGCNNFTNSLIIKLKKEGHRVYLLTGTRNESEPYQKVFERYNFPYDSECLNEIFESIVPEITIYMGAYDSNYNWKNEEADAVRYSGNMMNILMSYMQGSKGRFVYLSSSEIYEGDYEEPILEDEPANSAEFKGLVLAQAESMCDTYRKTTNKDIVVLRLDNVFMLPYTNKDVIDPVSKMCLQAMDRYVISIDENNTFSMLYVSDAIEFIYKVAYSRDHDHDVYNIAAGEAINERSIAELVQKYMQFDVEIVPVGSNLKRKMLSADRFNKEFGATTLCDNSTIVKNIVDQMKKYRQVFLYGEERRKSFKERLLDKAGWLIKALVPFAENILAFIVFFVLNNRALESKYFNSLDLFLLYVLLFAIVYGQQQAIVSATLAILGYCFRQSLTRSSFEVMLDSNTYIWIAQLFIVGLAVGYMRDYIKKLKREEKSDKEYLNMQLTDIREINNSNVRVKDALETQIVNQNDSVGKIYSITTALNQYSEEEVLFYAAETISKLVKSDDVAIYTTSGDTYARLFSATSKKAKCMGNSIKYTELLELTDAISDHDVYINRKLDERYPHMAVGISDENGYLQVLVMIWGLPWESMTLGLANQLVVVSALIRDAVIRANRYIALLDEKRYLGDSRVLEKEAFASLVKAYILAERKGLTDCMVLQVVGSGKINNLYASEKIQPILRENDYIGRLSDGQLYILLANTNRDEASFVIDRLAKQGYECQIYEDVNE